MATFNKTCSCGKVHTIIPGYFKVNDLGIWWQCECQSTMFIPLPSCILQTNDSQPKEGHVSVFIEQLHKRIGYLKQEIENVQDEMDRCDSFDTYRYDLRKRLIDLQKELEQDQKFLQGFEQPA